VNELIEACKDEKSKPTEAPKKVVFRGRSTRSQYRPKRNTGKPDKDDATSFLTAYASTKTPR
jgi:hypothetical protein